MSSTERLSPSAPPLQITVGSSSHATTHVTIVGEIDLATAPLLRDQLICAMHDQTLDLLNIDLSGVKFLDCAGIGALIHVRNTAARSGRRVRLAHTQPIVRRILDVTGLLPFLTADPNELEPDVLTTSEGSSL
jgi:anti-anti-sigma factor